MERSVLRILGKRGRTTIPWPIRKELDFGAGDVLLFEADPPDRVVITRMEVYEPEEVEEPDLTGDIFTEAFHKLSYNQQYRLLAALLADFHLQKGVLMATRKENIDIEYDEPQQEAVSGSAESNGPYESQDPADWVPPMTVRIYPISKPRTKLLATANVNIAKSFAVQGFRIYDSKNGLFVKEPQRSYVKNGTEMTSSVFFPVTKEARDALYSQILNSYEMVMEQQERQHPQQQDELEELLEDGDLPFAQPYEAPPPPMDEDAPVMSM